MMSLVNSNVELQATVQRILDENKQIIIRIQTLKTEQRAIEVISLMQRFRTNLSYLAFLSDQSRPLVNQVISQPQQATTIHPRPPPSSVMPPDAKRMRLQGSSSADDCLLPQSAIARLSGSVLSRLFDYCSPHKKLTRLRFVDSGFHNLVFKKSSWKSVHTIKFISFRNRRSYQKHNVFEIELRPTIRLLGSSLFYPLTQSKIDDMNEVFDLLTNVRVITGLPDTGYTKFQNNEEFNEFLSCTVHKLVRTLRLIDVSVQTWSDFEEVRLFYHFLIDLLAPFAPTISCRSISFSSDPESVAWNRKAMQLSTRALYLDEEHSHESFLPELIENFKNKSVRSLSVSWTREQRSMMVKATADLINALRKRCLTSLSLDALNIGRLLMALDNVISLFARVNVDQLRSIEKLQIREENIDRIQSVLGQFLPITKSITKIEVTQMKRKCSYIMKLPGLIEMVWQHTRHRKNKKQIVKFCSSSYYPTAQMIKKLKRRLTAASSAADGRIRMVDRTDVDEPDIVVQQQGVALSIQLTAVNPRQPQTYCSDSDGLD